MKASTILVIAALTVATAMTLTIGLVDLPDAHAARCTHTGAGTPPGCASSPPPCRITVGSICIG